MTNQPFTLGVNYWPRREAMFWWSNFDAGEVKEEFAVIQELGMHLVRPDGSLKPHAEVIKRFVTTRPKIQPARWAVTLDISPEVYYYDRLTHARRFYQKFLDEQQD
jgi:hypothetical protein